MVKLIVGKGVVLHVRPIVHVPHCGTGTRPYSGVWVVVHALLGLRGLGINMISHATVTTAASDMIGMIVRGSSMIITNTHFGPRPAATPPVRHGGIVPPVLPVLHQAVLDQGNITTTTGCPPFVPGQGVAVELGPAPQRAGPSGVGPDTPPGVGLGAALAGESIRRGRSGLGRALLYETTSTSSTG